MIKFQYEFNTWKNWSEFYITPSASVRWNRYADRYGNRQAFYCVELRFLCCYFAVERRQLYSFQDGI
jgi:hypothetical protein